MTTPVVAGIIVVPTTTTTSGGGTDGGVPSGGGGVTGVTGGSTVVNPGHPLTAVWTSWTGDEWVITDRHSPVFALQGADGIEMADPEHWWGADDSGRDGSDWTGGRTPRGEVFLPIRIEGNTSDDFLATRAAWRKSLDPTKESTLRIIRPDGQSRSIKCRYESGAKTPIELDPVLMRRATYGPTFATPDPYWRGDPVTVAFPYAVAGEFYNVWPPVLNSAETLGSATVTNLGDVPTSAVWHVDGPFTGFSVSVNGAVVALTLTKTAGQWVEIDSRPGHLSMVDDTGTRVWRYATKENLIGMAVPPGASVPLTIEVDGAASGSGVTVTFEPGYRDGF